MTKNETKYGKHDEDVITDIFKVNYQQGVGFTIGNIMKYFRRYISADPKANNAMDLKKGLDYLDRVAKKTPDYRIDNEFIFVKLRMLIENEDYKAVYLHCLDLLNFLKNRTVIKQNTKFILENYIKQNFKKPEGIAEYIIRIIENQ